MGGWDRADRDRSEVAPQWKGLHQGGLRADSPGRGVSRGCEYHSVRAGQPLQPRTRPVAQAAAAPPGDRPDGRRGRAGRAHPGAARALLQQGPCEGGARAGQGQEAARQAGSSQAPHRRAGNGPRGVDQGATVITALALLAILAGDAPRTLMVSTPRGDQRIAVRSDRSGTPLVSAPELVAALGGTVKLGDAWADVTVAQQGFRFLIGAPLFLFNDRLEALAAPVTVVRDTMYLPFQFVSEVLPTFLAERYHYDKRSARLVEERGRFLASGSGSARLANGRRPGHRVTVDAGHGGVDPGNPGMFFPRGVKEKDVTLQVALLLREELRRRGVAVRMTRTTDTLIALGERGSYCTEKCDLFVSLHVNSLPHRRGFTETRGFETYFLA